MKERKFNVEQMEQLYKEGKNIYEIATTLGCSKSLVWKHLPKSIIRQRTTWNKENDEELTKLYQSGLGYLRCSKHFNSPQTTIQHACRRLGINEPSRVFTKQHKSSRERMCKRKPFEFSKMTKRLCFEREKGICQWCHLEIESRFKATYHHIKMIDAGGDGLLENCMVLHRKCHLGNFEALHSGRQYEHLLASKERIPTIWLSCVICNEPKQYIFNNSTCLPCWVETIGEEEMIHEHHPILADKIGCSVRNLLRTRKRLGLLNVPCGRKNKRPSVG